MTRTRYLGTPSIIASSLERIVQDQDEDSSNLRRYLYRVSRGAGRVRYTPTGADAEADQAQAEGDARLTEAFRVADERQLKFEEQLRESNKLLKDIKSDEDEITQEYVRFLGVVGIIVLAAVAVKLWRSSS